MPEPCSCCRGNVPAVSLLLRRSYVGHGRDDALPSPDRRHRLCGTCHKWVSVQLRRIRSDDRTPPSRMLGAPSPAGRANTVKEQCHLCRMPLGEGAAQIDAVFAENATADWTPILVCAACDRWVGSLLSDGRSVQGTARREIDGPYGTWLHANVRSLSVELQVDDADARDAILTACGKMGVDVDPDGRATVVMAEPGSSRSTPMPGQRRILVVALSHRRRLLEELAGDVVSWLTLPLTPQQVAAALGRVVGMPGLRLTWDPETALPVASLRDYTRPALLATPAPGVDPFEVAWLVKRFSRGYDEIVSYNGHVVLLPRAPASHTDAVAARLQRLLGDRCAVAPLPLHVTLQRLDASA